MLGPELADLRPRIEAWAEAANSIAIHRIFAKFSQKVTLAVGLHTHRSFGGHKWGLPTSFALRPA